jgi:DNA-binding GntR family transcriptional regulator
MLEVEPKEKSLSEVAYEHIKLKVLELVYFPGMYLNEESLAKELGMSRMPIRTAVQRLADEGWLIVCFRKQLRVSDITSKDILELYEIRELLEMMAINRIFAEGTNWC